MLDSNPNLVYHGIICQPCANAVAKGFSVEELRGLDVKYGKLQSFSQPLASLTASKAQHSFTSRYDISNFRTRRHDAQSPSMRSRTWLGEAGRGWLPCAFGCEGHHAGIGEFEEVAFK
ncbi:MAG: hypothetical protein LBU32_10745 [Clostridiales bacterium]|nr:hypothetical protein [Clostridiales bacterium]